MKFHCPEAHNKKIPLPGALLGDTTGKACVNTEPTLGRAGALSIPQRFLSWGVGEGKDSLSRELWEILNTETHLDSPHTPRGPVKLAEMP